MVRNWKWSIRPFGSAGNENQTYDWKNPVSGFKFYLNKYLFDHYLNNMCVKLLLYGLKAKWMGPITSFGNCELYEGLTLFDPSFSFSRWPGGRWIPPPLLCIEKLSKMYIQLYIYKEHRCKSKCQKSKIYKVKLAAYFFWQAPTNYPTHIAPLSPHSLSVKAEVIWGT